MRNERLLLEFVLGTTFFESIVHLSLPAAVVLREWHIEVSDISAACLILTSRQLLLRALAMRRILNLVWLEGAISECIVMRLLTTLLLLVEIILTVEFNIFIPKSRYPTIVLVCCTNVGTCWNE